MKAGKYIKGFIGIAIFSTLVYITANFGLTTHLFSPISNDAIVSGIHLGALNRDQLSKIQSNPANIAFQLNEKNGIVETVEAKDFVENPIQNPVFKKIVIRNINKTNNNILPFNSLAKNSIDPDSLIYNKKNLEEIITKLAAFNVSTVPTSNANIIYNDTVSLFQPVPEKIGTEVDKISLIDNIVNKIENAQNDEVQVVNLEQENIYKQPKYRLDSPVLNNLINQLNNNSNVTLTYDIGWKSYPLNVSIYGPWIKMNDNGNMYIDQVMFKDYIDNLSISSSIFTSKEEALQEKAVLSGYLINYTTEAIEDRNAILNNVSTTRTLEEFDVTIDDIAPIYTQQRQERLAQVNQQLGSEFVYINKTDQFLWYYKDNQLLVATPITSGTKYAHDSPSGLYYIQAKSMNVTLKGENDDGSKYESPVVYWMPYDGGIGIHDADNWRSSYGSDVYEYNGSHGCINTPREKCKIIYENISVDCPVLVEE